MFLDSRTRPVREANNVTTICEPNVYAIYRILNRHQHHNTTECKYVILGAFQDNSSYRHEYLIEP
jgi:hypothetical protein